MKRVIPFLCILSTAFPAQQDRGMIVEEALKARDEHVRTILHASSKCNILDRAAVLTALGLKIGTSTRSDVERVLANLATGNPGSVSVVLDGFVEFTIRSTSPVIEDEYCLHFEFSADSNLRKLAISTISQSK